MAGKRGGLGKGLDSLIPEHKSAKQSIKEEKKLEKETETQKSGEIKVPINKVKRTKNSREEILRRIHFWN